MSFSLAIPAIIMTLGLSAEQVGLVATVSLFASAVGGWIAGMLADRFGRIRALQITVGWFAVFAFLSGFAQNFQHLLVSRALMGFGFGGEWAVGAILVVETVGPRHRGKATGLMQSSWAVGWALAVLISSICFTLLSQSTAWRVLFWSGLAPAILAIFARRLLDEPTLYLESRKLHKTYNPFDIFDRGMRKRIALCAMLTTGAQSGYFSIAVWLPQFLKTERHLTEVNSTLYLAAVVLGSFVGYVTAAFLVDRVGRRLNFVLFAVGSAAAVIGYMVFPIGNNMGLMLILGFPLGFFASGIYSGMGSFLAELFPTSVRGSAQSFTYNFGRGMAALNPTLIALMRHDLTLGGAIAAMAVFSYGLVVAAALTLPETHGRMLIAD